MTASRKGTKEALRETGHGGTGAQSSEEQAVYSPERCGCRELGFELARVDLARGSRPQALAVNRDGKALYVVHDGGGLSVIDVATPSVIATRSTGNGPMGIAMHPTQNRAYVANFGDQTISVYDTATHNPIAPPIQVQSGATRLAPASLAVSSDGARLFVNSDTWGNPGGLAWIDLAGLSVHLIQPPAASISVIAGMPFTRNPYGVSTSLLGSQFFATYRSLLLQREVRRADPNTNSFVSFQVELLPCALLPHGENLIVTGYKTNGPEAEDLGIDVFRQNDMQRLHHIDVPGLAAQLMPGAPILFEGFGFSLRAAALDPTCPELWYGNPTDGLAIGHVGIVSLETGQFRTFAVEDCQGIAFTQDGRHAFLSDTRNDRVIRVKVH